MSTALWIDTTSRSLTLHTVSITQAKNGLVVRSGAEVGPLATFTKNGEFKNEDLPIIIDLRCYGARITGIGGFVEVDYTPDKIRKDSIIGAMGMPWQGGTKSLRPIKPIPVLVCGPATNIIPVKRNYIRNAGAASAMYMGLKKVRQQMEPQTVFITEGQREYIEAWRLASSDAQHATPLEPKWAQEHREDMFTPEAILKSVLWHKTWKPGITPAEQEALAFLHLNIWEASETVNQKSGKFPYPEGITENPAFEELLIRMEQEGWKVEIELHSANRFTKVITPTGEEFRGPSLRETPKLEKAFI